MIAQKGFVLGLSMTRSRCIALERTSRSPEIVKIEQDCIGPVFSFVHYTGHCGVRPGPIHLRVYQRPGRLRYLYYDVIRVTFYEAQSGVLSYYRKSQSLLLPLVFFIRNK